MQNPIMLGNSRSCKVRRCEIAKHMVRLNTHPRQRRTLAGVADRIFLEPSPGGCLDCFRHRPSVLRAWSKGCGRRSMIALVLLNLNVNYAVDDYVVASQDPLSLPFSPHQR